MITLDNCEEWFCQQPEKLAFIEVNWQDDMRVLCELEKSKTTREQWDKTVDKFVNRECRGCFRCYKSVPFHVRPHPRQWYKRSPAAVWYSFQSARPAFRYVR